MILTHFIAFDFWPGAAPSDYVEPEVPAVIVSGGAVIVEEEKKKKQPKRKKNLLDDESKNETISQSEAKEITEAEVLGMEAIYGTPFREKVEYLEPSQSIKGDPESLTFEPILTNTNLFTDYQQIEEIKKPEKIEEFDDIALILAIIEAIG